MLTGILAALATGALWGLIFIAPLGVAPYSGVDLAMMRYLMFAATSLAVFALIPASRIRNLTLPLFLNGLWLGFLGYSLFYGFLVIAVAHAGPQIAALVCGLLPIALAIAGNLGGKVRWRALIVPLTLIAAGLLLVNGYALAGAPTPQARGEILIGVVAALCSVVSWVAYGVLNARTVERVPNVNTMGWAGLQGIGAGLGIVLFGIAAWPFGLVNIPELGFLWPDAKSLLVWAAITGIAGGWLATFFWITATKRLPLVLTGQLYVAEPATGVIYGFLWEGRWPSWPEALGIAAVFGGVLFGIAAVGRARGRKGRALPTAS
jgi:drug/metabolite transporter (DMT)-like permease